MKYIPTEFLSDEQIKGKIKGLREDIEKYPNSPFRDELAELEKKFGMKQFSVSEDSQGRELTKEQIEYFKDSQTRDETGKLETLYHGTHSLAFTEFDMENGVWLAASRDYAKEYSNLWYFEFDDEDSYRRKSLNGLEQDVYSDKNSRLYEVYANIVERYTIFGGSFN